MNVTLRPAILSDLDTLNAVMKLSKAHWGYDTAFMEKFMELFSITKEALDQSTASVALVNKTIIGFYQLVFNQEGDLELENIFVHPDYIGRGIGQLLWSDLCQSALSLGKSEFTLWSDPNAESFYLKMGCQKIGTKASPMMPGRYPSIFKFTIDSPQLNKT